MNVRAGFGELMRDATLPFPETPPTTPFSAWMDDDVVTFEFKVKSGLYSTSPFLPQDRRLIKLHVGRYALLQMYKYSRFVGKVHEEDGKGTYMKCPWGTFDRTSSYDPSDLCSRDERRVCKALAALTESPQNNLRVFVNGKNRAEACELKLTTDEFSPLLNKVFCEEELLEQLQAIQRLDFLDIEGACAVFDRLCVITGGSTLASEDIIASYREQKYDWIVLAAKGTLKYLRDSNATTASSKSSNVASFAFPCDTIIQTLIDFSISLQTSSSGDDEYAASHALVALLTSDECALLLNLWLLALSAKDASVMVAFRQVQLPGPGQERHVHQTESHSGFVVSSTSSCTGTYAYSLSLIDIGPKAIQKCWNKRSEEEAICAAYRAMLST